MDAEGGPKMGRAMMSTAGFLVFHAIFHCFLSKPSASDGIAKCVLVSRSYLGGAQKGDRFTFAIIARRYRQGLFWNSRIYRI